MKKAVFFAYLVIMTLGGICASCNDYRKFVDYIERTDAPYEVACETDYYTERIQEDLTHGRDKSN